MSIQRGDRVVTPDGDVARVVGVVKAPLATPVFKAEDVQKVKPGKAFVAKDGPERDCIVWDS